MGKDLREYGISFRSVVGNPNISKGARLLYSLLVTWRDIETDACYPGSKLLCEHMGSDRQQVNVWLLELERHNVIRRDTRFNNENHRKIRTIVILDDNYRENNK